MGTPNDYLMTSFHFLREDISPLKADGKTGDSYDYDIWGDPDENTVSLTDFGFLRYSKGDIVRFGNFDNKTRFVVTYVEFFVEKTHLDSESETQNVYLIKSDDAPNKFKI